MLIEFEADDETLGVVDRVERRRIDVVTDAPVSPTPADTDVFPYPVDRAVSASVSELTVEDRPLVLVMDGEGAGVARVGPDDAPVSLPAGEYVFDISDTVKMYVSVPDAAVTVSTDVTDHTATLSFPEQTTIYVGARSFHEEPATTLTTTDDPADVMAAVSTFGSALKDTSPMRSYPTLRGHPPDIERGDELVIPEVLDTPDTGVTIELPERLDAVYASASLAFYLGAAVEPGEVPRITTDRGFEYRLDTDHGVVDELARVLKHVFVLDVVVRPFGPYDYVTEEHETIAPELDAEPEALYDASIAERLEPYLDVPHDAVMDAMPPWMAGARVDPTPTNVEALPHLANQLATVQPPTVTDAAVDIDTAADVVVPEPVDALYPVWVADGAPVGASKPTVPAYRAAFDREPVDGVIDYAVVCNDTDIADGEETVATLLSNPRGLDIDIRPYRELYVDELRALLERGADVFHFIGEVDDGFVCKDGTLAVDDLDDLGVDSFVLTATDSYDAGLDLVNAGAASGVAILGEVDPGTATSMGQFAAQLLNLGFSMGSAVEIATRNTDIGEQFVVLGDATEDITQPPGVPTFVEVLGRDGDTLSVRGNSRPSKHMAIGSVLFPTMLGEDSPSLAGRTTTGELDINTLLGVEPPVPVELNGDVYLSDVLSRDDF